MISGCASSAGTARFRDRFPALKSAGHFRRADNVPDGKKLFLSSVGLGTYLGEADENTDRSYVDAIRYALSHGINVLDTAINYRNQRSERNLGQAIRQLIDAGQVARNEFLVCSKAGYLPFDGDVPADPGSYLREQYVTTGIAPADQIAGGMHCMAPSYLADQLERTRRNTGLETIDVFYVHNPETQLGYVPSQVFYDRLRKAFEFLERAVADKKIQWYGVATWNGLRTNPTDRSYLSLEQIVNAARSAAGDSHRFRFVQLPFNLAMLEAYAYSNQTRNGVATSLLKQAPELGVAVVASATLYQGNLAQGLPPQLKKSLGTEADSETAIQFARSAPGLLTALVGMSRREHVEANLKIARVAPVPSERWESMFTK